MAELTRFTIFTVYILYSHKFDKIYIGYTANLIQRFYSHNKLAKKGWTMRYRPWTVIFTEDFNNKSEAMKRENALKSGQGRQWIWNKIHQQLEQQGFIAE